MDAHAAVVVAAARLTIRPRTVRWAHLSLCVLDAVFSIGARYSTTVRTCESYAAHARLAPRAAEVVGTDDEQRLDRFVAGVDDCGIEAFAATVLRNRQRTSSRGGVLKAATARAYAEVLVDAGVRRYADLPALLGDDGRQVALEAALRAVPGNGTGDVRLGYLWMLLGDDDIIKPDRMVLRWLEQVLGTRPSPQETRALLAAAAAELRCTPWELDRAIWNAQRTGPRVGAEPAARRRHRAHQGRWRREVLGVPRGHRCPGGARPSTACSRSTTGAST